jgi:hypothetical protein
MSVPAGFPGGRGAGRLRSFAYRRESSRIRAFRNDFVGVLRSNLLESSGCFFASPPAMAEVAAAIKNRFQVPRGEVADLMRSVAAVQLTAAEFSDFLRICDEAGTPPRAQLDTLRAVLRCIDRYGDDGYGDKPADMSRVVYWFQHVPPPARSRSPRRAPRARQ